MATIQARTIFKKVRANLNRVPVSSDQTITGIDDEAPWTQENTVVAASGTIADEILLYHMNYVVRHIVNSCKVFHLDNTSEDGVISTGPTVADDEIPMRVVHGSIRRKKDANTEIRARYRELSEHRDMELSGRNATEDFPAYTYTDHEVEVFPDDSTYGSLALYVISPSTISVENMVNFSDVLAVDSRFECPIVCYVTAMAFRQLEEHGLHDLWMNLYNRSLEPFQIGTRIGDPRTHLISAISYERENEVE